MKVRPPCVAGPGSFYPSDPDELRRQVESLTVRGRETRAWAVLVPHAGYRYSGGVAGEVYGRVSVPRRIVLLCFHHRGHGEEFALWPPGAWETPIGSATVPEEWTEEIRRATGAVYDEQGHRQEHSGEVQIPFLLARRPDVQLAPVALSSGWEAFDRLEEFGRRLAGIGGEFLVVASSDLNHYDPHEETLAKDRYVIDAVEALDAAALKRALTERGVTMCGFAPALAMIAYARARGAEHAELLSHRTSADAGGGRERTVGYAGMIVARP